MTSPDVSYYKLETLSCPACEGARWAPCALESWIASLGADEPTSAREPNYYRARFENSVMAKVKHIALIKFRAGTSAEQIEKVFAEILDLTETIPGIEDHVSGENCSPEGLSQGFTHGFVMTFSDAAARDAYLAHPDRQREKSAHMAFVESVVVFDFVV